MFVKNKLNLYIMAKEKKDEQAAEIKAPVLSKKVLAKKTFNLDKYKEANGFNKVEYKQTEWLKVSQAFADATGVPGIPMGHFPR